LACGIQRTLRQFCFTSARVDMAAGDVEANCRDERDRVGVASLVKELPPSSSRFAKDMLALLLAKRVWVLTAALHA
jgi:hypothetical protein